MSLARSQRGVTTVEFAVVGALALILLFAVIEVGRSVFVLNALGESTRRSARMAAVCPIDDPAIREVAFFNAPGEGTGNGMLGNLAPENILVEYLDANGNVLANPAGSFGQIRFVRTRISGFQHEMLIPFLPQIFSTPEFATTLRRESLGVPREGVITPC